MIENIRYTIMEVLVGQALYFIIPQQYPYFYKKRFLCIYIYIYIYIYICIYTCKYIGVWGKGGPKREMLCKRPENVESVVRFSNAGFGSRMHGFSFRIWPLGRSRISG